MTYATTSERFTARQPDARLAFRLSIALIFVGGLAAASGLLAPRLFRDPAMSVGNARGTGFVILFVAIPTVITAMQLAARGSLRARIVWLGALYYLLYNSVIFAFAVSFNSLFLLYVMALSLSVWSCVALVARVNVSELPARFEPRIATRGIGSYLVGIAIVFALVWLADVVPGLVANEPPAGLRGTVMLTNPVEVIDLGFTLPLTFLAGIWLWQRRPWGLFGTREELERV